MLEDQPNSNKESGFFYFLTMHKFYTVYFCISIEMTTLGNHTNFILVEKLLTVERNVRGWLSRTTENSL